MLLPLLSRCQHTSGVDLCETEEVHGVSVRLGCRCASCQHSCHWALLKPGVLGEPEHAWFVVFPADKSGILRWLTSANSENAGGLEPGLGPHLTA